MSDLLTSPIPLRFLCDLLWRILSLLRPSPFSSYACLTPSLRVILSIPFQKAQCFLRFRLCLHQYWPVFARGLRVKNQNHPMFTQVLTGLRLQTPKLVGRAHNLHNLNLTLNRSCFLAPALLASVCSDSPLFARNNNMPRFTELRSLSVSPGRPWKVLVAGGR